MPSSSKKLRKNNSDEASKLNKSSKQPFKPKAPTKKRNEPQNDAVSSRIDDDEPSFPRGGGSSLSRKEREEVRAEVDAEFEAEENQNPKDSEKKNKKKKSKQRIGSQSRSEQHDEDDLGSLFGGSGISGKFPRQANKITLKNVSPGMKLWGVVSEVDKRDLTVSLPGGLRGLVRASDAFDPIPDGSGKCLADDALSTVFHVGQLVACVVLHLDEDNGDRGKRRIWLSLRLSLLHKGYTLDSIQEGMVLTASVKSIEDHGYILHFGLSSYTGFLPKKNQSEFPGVAFSTGQLVQGIVKTIDKTRKVVYLSPDLDTVSKHVTKDLKGISIDLLVPGMMVNARVQSTLENGVLLSFLTYFTGTVDILHLQNSFATTSWKEDYTQHKKVNARILFIDPSSRAIGLTLNQHLVHNKSPPSNVKIGEIYENAKVVRVDKGLGIFLETPSMPEPTPTYVSKHEVDEDEFRKFEKKLRAGSCVRVRVLGFRSLDGIATGTSKANSFEGSVYTHSDAIPGMIVRAKIIAVDPFGAIVRFPGGIKAKCPLPHMSELEISKPGKKFAVGAELVFRVLGGKSKRLTVTHKKSLVKSKLPIVSSYGEANDGLITHGWITKIEKHGCFVRFYNGVQGFAPRSELQIEPGRDPNSIYHVGQVVKCRIISSVPASRRINVSFIITPSRVAEEDIIKVGSLVSGVVDIITENAVIVYVNGKKHLKGTIRTEHLADHHGQATYLKSIIKPGFEFEELVLLDTESNNMIFSAKYSLIKSTEKLPSEFSQIRPNSAFHGYVCNVIETGCFVRFLGRLTGFSPKSKALDDTRIDLADAFYVGQSVRSNIVDVNNETSRMTLSLKPSSFSSIDASFMQDYFLLEEKIAKLQSGDPELNWTKDFSIGCVVKGKVQEVKNIGLVVSFDSHDDVFGFITQYQLAGKDIQMGSTMEAVVLDLSKTENLVDLSLKAELLSKLKKENSLKQSLKKKRKRETSKGLEISQTVDAVVEIVKDNYLVVSVPEFDHAIGYVSIVDYNSQKFPRKQFLNGQSVVVTVAALPSPSTAGKLLLVLKSNDSDASNSKKAKKKSGHKVGSLIQAEITEIRPLELRVKFGSGLHGRIHITELSDDKMENPFSKFRVGQVVKTRIVEIKSDGNRRISQFDLSIRPSVLTDSFEIEDKGAEELDFPTGQRVSGYVDKVDSEWVWLTISRNVRAQLYILDSSSEPSELKKFTERFNVGQLVSGYLLSVNKDKWLLRLVLHPLRSLSSKSSDVDICEGCNVGGRVSKILPGIMGLVIKIGPHTYGRAHFVELTDSWVSDPLSEFREGQFVKCNVLEIKDSFTGSLQIDLSLRSSLKGNNVQNPIKFVEKIEDLQPDMVVQGYVKNISPKGCFIMLSRKLDAKILLSHLSDGFVKDPEIDFPIGKLVTGRVLSVEPLSKRVEVTLRLKDSEKATDKSDLSSLHVGDVISGRIKQVQHYGLFISINDTNLVGLCHKSEALDDLSENIVNKYNAGQRVRAKVLKIDQERNRISLGINDVDQIDDDGAEKSEDDEDIRINDSLNDSAFLEVERMDSDSESAEVPLAQAESRAFVPPLEVALDDIDREDLVSPNQDSTNATLDEKSKRRADKKSKKEREREIKAAEERLLEKDIPRTSEEFEKLVRGSPNSSFVWIKYMAFALSMAEVDKARSIAERALQTINIREENEKLNIWVAYFNLENEYGNPPEEAVQKIFQRALQYNDPKRVHLALLGMYERAERHSSADELVDKMTKKFKQSCKVWLRRVQRLLNRQQDTVQSVVNRALLSLPRHKHIKFISQTAILEFKCGVPHRGRSMFEGILKEYPKRTDLWSIYLDQEIKLGDVEVIRALFERATCLRLPTKKMKFLFKKYLEYEKTQGDEERVEYVKKKAMEYVESTLAV